MKEGEPALESSVEPIEAEFGTEMFGHIKELADICETKSIETLKQRFNAMLEEKVVPLDPEIIVKLRDTMLVEYGLRNGFTE